jgi:hypothetical protein
MKKSGSGRLLNGRRAISAAEGLGEQHDREAEARQTRVRQWLAITGSQHELQQSTTPTELIQVKPAVR